MERYQLGNISKKDDNFYPDTDDLLIGFHQIRGCIWDKHTNAEHKIINKIQWVTVSVTKKRVGAGNSLSLKELNHRVNVSNYIGQWNYLKTQCRLLNLGDELYLQQLGYYIMENPEICTQYGSDLGLMYYWPASTLGIIK